MTVLLVVLASLAAGPPSAPVPATAWAQAHGHGKYRVLLRQLKDPDARSEHSDFKDVGRRDVTEWKGERDLPAGYWVYVDPYWYIWRETTAGASAAAPKVAYSPEQATGPPDTPAPGDQSTAWASATPDQQEEWLELQFAEAVVPSALKVYETCSPGALTGVSVWKLDGTEEVVWSGRDPTPSYSPMGVSVVPIAADQPVARVRIRLNSPAFPGWNEIDAVGLVDSQGKTQWAVAALASTTFGAQNLRVVGPAVGGGVVLSTRPSPAQAVMSPPSPSQSRAVRSDPTFTRLASELEQSRRDYAELKQLLQKSQDELKALRRELEALKRRVPPATP